MRDRKEVETNMTEDEAPSGSARQGYVTYVEDEKYLVDHIRAYIHQQLGNCRYSGPYLHGLPKLTIHECWSGYSEYTVTSQWHEVGLEWDGHSYYFASSSEFLKALSEVPDDLLGQ